MEQPIKLVPVCGDTEVEIETSGEYEVIDCKATVHRGPRQIVLAATEFATLSRSPMGMNRTVRVTLPTEMATMDNFIQQVESVFEVHNLSIDISL